MKKIRVSKMSHLFLLGALNVTFLSSVMADELAFGKRTPSVDDFVEGLTVSAEPASPQPRFRGIKPASVKKAEEPAKVSMELRFEFDSAVLSDESKQTLDNLSNALMAQELERYTFMIEGHTDATGSDEYNMDLSRRRAGSVMDYLTSERNVDGERLRVVGKGETSLLDKTNPNSGANRRVAIVNLGE